MKPARKSGAKGPASARKASGALCRNPKKSHAQPVRAAIYARTAAPLRVNHDTLTPQIDACMRTAAEEGLTVEDPVFIDSGVSGHSSPTSRPGFRKLLRAVSTARRSFGAVICDDISRLSRNSDTVLELLQKLENHGIEAHFVAQKADGALVLAEGRAVADKLTQRRKGAGKIARKPKPAK